MTASDSPAADQGGHIARSTFVVMAGLGGAMVVGIIKQRVVASVFGTSSALDAYSAANAIPELLFNILAGGALAFAFIPIYTGLLEQPEKKPADRLFSQVLNSIFLLVLLAGLLVAVFAPALVRAKWGIGPNFPPAVQDITTNVMRILLLSTIIFAISSILTGTLYAHKHFVLPAISPIMYSVGIIIGTLTLSPRLGIYGVAWGAVIGALLHLGIQLPGILHFKVRWYPDFGWGQPDLKRVAILMLPRIIDLFMARVSIDWINANLGSGLGEGRVAALGYAKGLMNMPQTLIGTAIAVAVFPTLSELAARKDRASQRQVLSGSIRAIMTLALPAAVAMLLLGRNIIQLLYEGGEFTSRSTDLVYFALQFYMVVLLGQSLLEIVVRTFASQQDTWTPLFVSFFTTALNIGLAIVLSRPISGGGLEHGGLALANGLAVVVEVTIGLTILHIRWKGIGMGAVFRGVFKAAVSALVMGAAIYAVKELLDSGPLVELVTGGLVGLATFSAVALVLGISEVRTIPLALLRRLVARGSASTPS